MDSRQINPLIKHFRRPAIYLRLPSQGNYWSSNSLDLPENGELPVYPMTTADEITLKTPDALMNGAGIVSVIQSCCPNITNAWGMPSVDVDATLIAIRIASYGQKMDVNSRCPHCGEENDYEIELSGLLDQVKCPDYSEPVIYDGLKIYLKPVTYDTVTLANNTNFEETKVTNMLDDQSIDPEVKNARLREGMKRILELNDQLLVRNTECIETEDGVRVRDPEFIREFYQNAESGVVKAVQTRIDQYARQAGLPPSRVACSACSQPYQLPLEFDYSSFFGVGS